MPIPKKPAKKYTKNNKFWGLWSQCKKRRTNSKVWAIEQLGISDDDLNDVTRDTWRCDNWRDLPHDNLSKLQMTAKRILRERKKQQY